MIFTPSGSGDGFDALTIQMMIECFDESGESGPHSLEGWALAHILNHCHENGISFTLVHFPKMGYYVTRKIVSGVIPEEMRHTFGMIE